jgi:hypothetical protein
MKRVRSMKILTAVAVSAVSFWAGLVQAELLPYRFDATVNGGAQSVTFNISFSRTPDFTTVDGMGRQADSFQIWIDDSKSADPTYNGSVIVRGQEVHYDDDIRIRDRDGVGGPEAEGWGPVRNAVSYSMVGTNFSFTASWADLGLSDGDFSYDLSVLEYGSQITSQYGENDIVYEPDFQTIPEPSTAVLFGACLGVLGLMRRRIRKV